MRQSLTLNHHTKSAPRRFSIFFFIFCVVTYGQTNKIQTVQKRNLQKQKFGAYKKSQKFRSSSWYLGLCRFFWIPPWKFNRKFMKYEENPIERSIYEYIYNFVIFAQFGFKCCFICSKLFCGMRIYVTLLGIFLTSIILVNKYLKRLFFRLGLWLRECNLLKVWVRNINKFE